MSSPATAAIAAPATAGAVAPAQLATALMVSPLPAAVVRLDAGRVLVDWANQATHRLLGWPPDRDDVLTGTSWTRPASEPVDGDDPLADLLQRGGGAEDLVVRRTDGFAVHVRVHAFPLATAAPSFALHLEERTRSARASGAAIAAETRVRALAADAPIGIFASETGLRLGYVNRRAADLLGQAPADLLSTGWMGAVDERDLSDLVDALAATLAGTPAELVLRVRAIPGRWLRLRAATVSLPGQGTGFIGSLEDVTTERAHQEVLLHQASHDALTGLPNRKALRTAIEAVLDGRRHRDPGLALIFLDLDRFKIVNDSLGHAVGDALLREVADRLRRRVRDGDVLARFGGDEFVLLCPGLSSAPTAERLARDLLEALAEPLVLDGRSFSVTASIGVVVAEAATSAELLLRDADIAMYQAKESGRGRVAVFDEGARAQAEQRLRVVTDLRRALASDELTIAYQPIVHLRRRTMQGAEALLRWRHPEHRSLPIGDLIELAEETGVIGDIGDWVLARVCRDLAAWRRAGCARPAWVSVNVSASQLADAGFPDAVAEVVAAHGLAPADVRLELTEHALMTSSSPGQDALRRLRASGFLVAVDDFGTGYSSLAYLRHMPVDVLKIAAPFVAGLDEDGPDRAIVRAIVQLAAAIGVDVVAEGVETEGQRSVLDELGCPAVQGYLLGTPGAPAQLQRWAWPLADPDTTGGPPCR